MLKFVLLVGGNPMRLKFILDRLPCTLITLRISSLCICSFMLISFLRVLSSHLLLRRIVLNRLALKARGLFGPVMGC